MWIFQIYGKQFFLTFEQKEAYLKAINNGARFVKFGDLVLSDHFDFIISEEDMAKEQLMKNPILKDPDFRKYCETGSLVLANTLDKRYPSFKFQKEWDEANKNKNSLMI